MNGQHLIAATLQNLYYSVRGRPVLQGVNVEFFEGEVVCLMGGEERTILLRLLAGIDKPDDGSISIVGHDPFRDAEFRRKSIGYMPNNVYLPRELKAEELLSLAAYIRGLRGSDLRNSVNDVMSRLELDSLRDKRVGCLDESTRQLLVFACSVIHQPSLLLLEEPTSRLSVSDRYRMFSYIGRITDAEGLVIMASTDASIAAWIDRLLLFRNGSIVAEGSVRELIKQLYDPYTLTLQVTDVRRAIDVLSKIPSVRKVSAARHGVLRIWLDNPEESTYRALALLDSLGIGVKQLLPSDIDPCNALLEIIHRVEVGRTR